MGNKKKILYVTNITRNINSFFIPHINMLQENGYLVDCACKISGEHEVKKNKFKKEPKFFDVPFTRSPIAIKNFIALYKLIKIQKKENYDVIHVHSPIAGIYTRLLKIKFPKIKMVYTAHGFHFYKGSSKISWVVFGNIEKKFSSLTDVLVTINQEDYEVAQKFYCEDVRYINGVGVDFSEFKEISILKKIEIRKKIGLNKEDFVLIMVGEHNQNKNQIQLIKAMQSISDSKIKALFIGDGIDLEKNKKYIKDNHIKNCIILGFRNDVNELINMSDVLVSMSHREGLPKNIIEALVLKKPIIASNIRGNNELVQDNKNGYLIEQGDIENVKKAIMEVSKKEKYEKFSGISLEMSKKYEMEEILKELIKIY